MKIVSLDNGRTIIKNLLPEDYRYAYVFMMQKRFGTLIPKSGLVFEQSVSCVITIVGHETKDQMTVDGSLHESNSLLEDVFFFKNAC